jgi:hypothetical protein
VADVAEDAGQSVVVAATAGAKQDVGRDPDGDRNLQNLSADIKAR